MEIRNLSFSYGEKQIFRGLDLTLPERGAAALCGPSGCGKTTLLRLICGLERPAEGTITGQGTVSFLFQEDRLLPWLTVLENLTAVCQEKEALSWLSRVELADAAAERPDALSGGMRRRLALARALALPADTLLLDEPFTGMDPDLKGRLYPLLRECAEKMPVLMVTHDRSEAEALGAEVVQMPASEVFGQTETDDHLKA